MAEAGDQPVVLKVTGASIAVALPGHPVLVHDGHTVSLWTVQIAPTQMPVLIAELRAFGVFVEPQETLPPAPRVVQAPLPQCLTCSWFEPGHGCAAEDRVPVRQGTVADLLVCPIYGSSSAIQSKID